MNPKPLLLLLGAALGLCGCGSSLSSQQLPQKWSTGFWFWQGSDAGPPTTHDLIDDLFVHVGTISSNANPFDVSRQSGRPAHWFAYGRLPDRMPAAREYWVVFRYERRGIPDLQAVPVLAQSLSDLKEDATARHLNVRGLQLDIDSPTASLAEYARFLNEVKRHLPKGWQLSITALLDWFRDGTAIAEVVDAADEFVPQFYDVGDFKGESHIAIATGVDGPTAIAMKIDAHRWGPVFNRFRKPFRVGISSFGRARQVLSDSQPQSRYSRITFLRNIAPLDLATNSAFQLQAGHNQSDELVLSYSATRNVEIGYSRFGPGDGVQFILATQQLVREAVASAKQMAGRITGVVFFRWPGAEEALTMQPDEVLEAAGKPSSNSHRPNRIRLVNGGCAAVECVDIYMEGADPFAPEPVRYRIRASNELEYFIPDEGVPAQMTAPTELELSLPPFCARGLLYLGRAVSRKHLDFTVAREP
ncbi:MAG TPA: DUF3142 domain-containing protein [Bryobacteraceae bacterium]|nr:DUF3142 domain-containing protein [Bryobacteraceae bacterium]